MRSLLFLVSVWPLILHAQTSPVEQAPPKIAVLNFNAAVLQTAEAKQNLAALESRFAPRQAQLQTLNVEIEALRKQLANADRKLDDAQRATKEQSLSAKERQLQRQAEDLKEDSQGESQKVFQDVAQKVFAFLQQYAEERGYTAVLERGSDAQPIVWYAASNLDITEQLAKAFNLQNQRPISPAKATAPRP